MRVAGRVFGRVLVSVPRIGSSPTLLASRHVPAPAGGVAEVGLEHLAHVHAGRDAERVEDDVDGVPSAMYGMSSIGRILEMTPLLPWRPASLSPTEILRFWAT
jgi:hypothetical protein